MSTFRTLSVPCPACGVDTPARLAESANAGRHPAYRQQVLDGTFMCVRCQGCGQTTVVESELLYTDLARGQLIGVFPSERRAEGLAIEAGFRELLAAMAAEPGLAGRHVSLRRVVFGYAELREKLVSADAGLDDRVVEGLKLVLLARTRLPAGARGLLLVRATDEALDLEVVGVAPDGGGPPCITLPRAFALRLAGDAALAALLPLPADALWVNVARVAADAA